MDLHLEYTHLNHNTYCVIIYLQNIFMTKLEFVMEEEKPLRRICLVMDVWTLNIYLYSLLPTTFTIISDFTLRGFIICSLEIV